jgi:uncharacterized protein YkwD
MFLSLLLIVGLVACGEEPEQASVDPGQLDTVLAEYSADRAAVIAAVGEARGMELQTSNALDRAAARHALDLASHRTATHMGQDGSHPMTRLHEAGAGMSDVREFIFRVESDPEDLGRSAAMAWLAPMKDNGVLTEPGTHVAVAFAPLEDGGCVGVLLLAQR